MTSGGCARLEERKILLVNHLRAAYAWGVADDIPEHPHPSHFADGWKRGYYDVACGEDGTPPVLPPRKYWSAGYQNPKGREQIQAWFDGYRLGAQTAELQGVRDYYYVATDQLFAPHSIGAEAAIASEPLPGEEVPLPARATDLPEPSAEKPSAPSRP